MLNLYPDNRSSNFIFEFKSSDHTYVIKKMDDRVTLKVYNTSIECIHKKLVPNALGLDRKKLHEVARKGEFATKFIDDLITNRLLPAEMAPKSRDKTAWRECLRIVEDAIGKLKPTLMADPADIEAFQDPITMEVMNDPVIDQHGHTFDRSTVERLTQCPLSRNDFGEVRPNRAIRDQIEELRRQEPIPSLTNFQRENDDLAKSNLDQVPHYLKEKDYPNAIAALTNAFRYTNRFQDYATVHDVYEQMGESGKTVLAYLYLIKYQIENDAHEDVVKTLDKARESIAKRPLFDYILLRVLDACDQPERMKGIAQALAPSVEDMGVTIALQAYRFILNIFPSITSCHKGMAEIVEQEDVKRHYLLMGAIQAIADGQPGEAKKFVSDERLKKHTSFESALITQHALRTSTGEQAANTLIDLLPQRFKELGKSTDCRKSLKLKFSVHRDPATCRELISEYLAHDKPQKALHYYQILVDLLIAAGSWEEAHEKSSAALALAKECLTQDENADTTQLVALSEQARLVFEKAKDDESLNIILFNLGAIYMDSSQAEKAVSIYQDAFNRFREFDFALKLGDALAGTGESERSVSCYFEAFIAALQKAGTGNDETPDTLLAQLEKCEGRIHKVDVEKRFITLDQRMFMAAQLSTHRLNAAMNRHITKLEARVKNLTQLLSRGRDSFEERTLESKKKSEARANDKKPAEGADQSSKSRNMESPKSASKIPSQIEGKSPSAEGDEGPSFSVAPALSRMWKTVNGRLTRVNENT